MAIAPGFTYINCGHLWVVIAVLPGPPEKVVVSNLTTNRDGSDTTVVLAPGDHPFVKHDTVMNYADTRDYDKDDLAHRIENKYFALEAPFSPNILKTIQQGLLNSPFTPKLYKKACAEIIGENE